MLGHQGGRVGAFVRARSRWRRSQVAVAAGLTAPLEAGPGEETDGRIDERLRRYRPPASLVFRLARGAGALSRVSGRGGGGTIPGRIALALRPDSLREFTHNRTVVLVSGTNGKTTTTRFLATAVEALTPVVTNSDGANLMSGLMSPFLRPQAPEAVAVLEVDEAVLPIAIDATRPRIVVLLNLSRDQLDRFAEVGSHVGRWAAALRSQPFVQVVANAADPLVVAAVQRAHLPGASLTWVDTGAAWRLDAPLCPFCGDAWDLKAAPWFCSACGATQPTAHWRMEGPDSIVDHSGRSLPLRLAIPGRAAAANALMAAAAGGLLGLRSDRSLEKFAQVAEIQGRYLRQVVGGREVQLLLAKNPAGWAEVLEQLSSRPGELLLGINARTADGTDPSWLWDVPFEQLRGREVVVFGDRALDLSVRLHYAQVPHTVTPSLLTALGAKAAGDAVVAANYTAFVGARTALQQAVL